ncbi:MAG: twin transmembrane helix small protein [Pseudomonadota bacterium]
MTDNPMFIPAVIACLVVLGILGFGISTFAKGGEFSRKHSNKIMQWRLAAQFIAVILILVFVAVGRGFS